MTREELIEVMAKALCLWGHRATRWEHYKPEAVEVLAAIEAAGVRMVPAEATRGMLLNAGATPDGVSPRGGTDYLGKMLPKYYAAMLAASPYALKETDQ